MTTQTHTVPLSALKFGHDKKAPVQINPRVVNRTEAIDVLAKSIKHVGLVLPIAVTKNGSGDWYVVDGNRRLAALQKLAKEGVIEKDHPVPVHPTNLDLADAKALAANVTALPLHPVDKFERFDALRLTMSEQEIADAFALSAKEVKQVLALGALSPKVMDAWRKGEIDKQVAQVFTLAGSHKAQDAVFAKLAKEHNLRSPWAVRQAIVGDDARYGSWLNFVGQDVYEKAGGKVTVDLFGDDHVVSSPALLKQLVDQAVEAKRAELLADGWSFAVTSEEAGNRWMYQRINVKPKFTKEQVARVKELEKLLDGDKEPENFEALDSEHRALMDAGEIAGYTPEQKKKAGCYLALTPDGIEIDYGLVKPKAGASPTATKAADKADKKPKEPTAISNALSQRLSEQLNDALAECLKADPDLALAAVVAGFGASTSYAPGKPISVTERGLRTKQGGVGRTFDFASALHSLIESGRQNALNALAVVAARAVDTQCQLAERPPLKDKGIAALVNATKASAFRKAIAEKFDAKDYFASSNKATCLKAVEEALGKDHVKKIASWSKPDVAKYALTNVGKTKWLPPQLRSAHYDGPGKK